MEVRRGLVPFTALDRLSQKLGIDRRRLMEILGLSQRTAARRKRQGFLEPGEVDRLLRVARILEEAARVFGSEEKASRWLNAPHVACGESAPIDLLDSDAGAQLVRDELVRIDYGDFA